MASTWTRPVFQTRFPGPEVNVNVKRSLAGMNLTSSAVRKMKAACERLKLKYEVPFYLQSCCAHLGIPSKKLAFWMRQSRDSGQWAKIKELFEGTGWQVIFTTTRQIDQMTEDDLVAHLGEAVKELSK